MKTNGLYVNKRDRFDDMPLAQIVANFNTVYVMAGWPTRTR